VPYKAYRQNDLKLENRKSYKGCDVCNLQSTFKVEMTVVMVK